MSCSEAEWWRWCAGASAGGSGVAGDDESGLSAADWEGAEAAAAAAERVRNGEAEGEAAAGSWRLARKNAGVSSRLVAAAAAGAEAAAEGAEAEGAEGAEEAEGAGKVSARSRSAADIIGRLRVAAEADAAEAEAEADAEGRKADGPSRRPSASSDTIAVGGMAGSGREGGGWG
jgi:hypothetical protein